MTNRSCRWLGASALAAVLGSACASGDASEPVSTLRVGAATVREGSIGLNYLRNALSRETLVTIADDGRAEARVIESWSASPDGLEWRFKVRAGVRFHDGTPVTATDLAPQVRTYLASASFDAVEAVTAEGTDSILVRLHEPYAFLLEDLAVLSAQRTSAGEIFGTGPYEAVEQTTDKLTLRAIPGHYRGRPAIDRVEVQLFPDQRNAWSALMRDRVDMLYEVNRDSLEFVRGESSINVASFPRPYVYLLGLNLNHGALADARVRRALDSAVDRDALVRVSMAGQGEAARGHVWPRHWTYDLSQSPKKYDPVASVRLLTEAGLRLTSSPGRMPARLRLHCMVYEPLRELALLLQRQLAEVDVDLELEILPPGQIIERLVSGQYEAYVFEMASARGYKWPYQFWHSSTPYLSHGYKGADAILDAMRRAPNDDAFRAAAVAFQRRLHEDPPAVFLAWGRTSRAVSTRYEIPDGDEDIYHTIARWKLAVPVKP